MRGALPGDLGARRKVVLDRGIALSPTVEPMIEESLIGSRSPLSRISPFRAAKGAFVGESYIRSCLTMPRHEATVAGMAAVSS